MSLSVVYLSGLEWWEAVGRGSVSSLSFTFFAKGRDDVVLQKTFFFRVYYQCFVFSLPLPLVALA